MTAARPEPSPEGSFIALWPRTPVAADPRGIAVVESNLSMIAALCTLSIAEAWDSGRISSDHDEAHPFAAEVHGILGLGAGRAQEAVKTAAERVATARAYARALSASVPAAIDPIRQLRAEFGLSGLGHKVLMAIAAPALWPELARLYAIVANDAARPLCDELLVYELLKRENISRYDVARELAPQSPLARFGLVRARDRAGVRPFAELTVDPIVLARLAQQPVTDEEGGACVACEAGCALEDLFVPAAVRARLMAAVAHRGKQPLRLVVRGRSGSGRRSLLAALAARANRKLGVIDVALCDPEPRKLVESLRIQCQRAFLRGWLPCVTGAEMLSELAAREALRTALRFLPIPVALRLPHGADPPLDPGHIAIDIPALSTGERIALWRSALAAHDLEVPDVNAVAMRFNVGAGVIRQVVGEAAGGGEAQGSIDDAIKQRLQARMGKGAARMTRLASMDQLVLPEDILDSVRELVARVRHRHKVYESWGFERTMAAARGIVALFQGTPGTGKSMVAGVIARELGLELYRVDVSNVVSKWLGETEQNLAGIFDAAEEGHVMLLLDEADSLFAKRTEVKSSNERYANMQVNYLLSRLDSFDGLAVLTTNFGRSIDSAFQRRLSMRLTLPFPDEEARERLWRVHIPPDAPVGGALDLGALARRYRLSGGYIKNAALRAAFLAAGEDTAIRQDHLERAVALEYREVGKLSDTGVLE